MDNKSLSERDIFTKFIKPALRKAGWALSEETQLICKDYDAAALRLQVAATQPEQLCGLA